MNINYCFINFPLLLAGLIPMSASVGAEVEKAPEQLPVPKAIPPFGPSPMRMPRLADKPLMLGSTPRPTEETIKEFNQFIEGVIDPQNTLDLIEGRTRIILLKETPTQIQVANDGIIGHNLLKPKQLIVMGRTAGTTVMTFWFPDPKDKTKDKILSYLVRVVPDPEAKLRLQQMNAALEAEIRQLFPDSQIKLTLVGDKLAVTGQAKDVEQATKILRIIRPNSSSNANRAPINNFRPR